MQGHTDRCVTEVDIFVRLGKEIAGDVPLKVINDGEATGPSTAPDLAARALATPGHGPGGSAEDQIWKCVDPFVES